MDKKTLEKSAAACNISKSTAFTWRHKILGALKELADKTFLTGIVEADETFFNISYKGNHYRSKNFTMPRTPHKRGGDVHVSGLSSEKVCVPCAVNESGIAYGIPVKTGKIDAEGIRKAFDGLISAGAILCTDNEKAYIDFSRQNNIKLIQMPTGCRMIMMEGRSYNIQRINAYHKTIKGFIRIFHGVATKYLDHYLVWNNLMNHSKKDRNEIATQMIGQVLSFRKTIYGKDLSTRPPLPFAV